MSAHDLTTVSSKGQIVIPAQLRAELGMTAGTRVSVRRRGTGLILQPVTEEYINQLAGSLRGADLLADREHEHKRER